MAGTFLPGMALPSRLLVKVTWLGPLTGRLSRGRAAGTSELAADAHKRCCVLPVEGLDLDSLGFRSPMGQARGWLVSRQVEVGVPVAAAPETV